VEAGWVDRGTDLEARGRVSGWAAAEVRAAGELVVAEPAGAGVLVRLEAPACGTPVCPAVAVAPGRVAEVELVVAAVLLVERGRALVVPEVGGAPVAEAGPGVLVAVQVGVDMGLGGELEPALGPAAVAVRERALVVVAEGQELGGELEVREGKARRRENG